MCDFIMLQPSAAHADDQCGVVETLPVAGSAVTIEVTTGIDGYWMAFGR
jgi:hypothetical protein